MMITENKTRFNLIQDKDFSSATSSTEWFVKKVIPKAQLGMVFGASGAGKSFWVIDLFMTIAYANEDTLWRGLRVKPARVAYVAAEGSEGVKKRLEAYKRTKQQELNGQFTVLADSPSLIKQDDVEGLITLMNSEPFETPIEIIVVDTLACVAAGVDENSSQMGIIIENCKYIANATGCMVVLIHHTGKDVTKGARGWSGQKGAMDFEIAITEEAGGIKTATLTKMKDGEKDAVYPFKLEVVELAVDKDGDPITSCVVNHDAQVIATSKAKLGTDEAITLKIMESIVDSGRQMVTREELRRSVIDRFIANEFDERSAKSKADRAIRELVKKTRIFENGNKTYSLPILEEEFF